MCLQGDTPHAKAIARALNEKLSDLAEALSSATAQKVCCIHVPLYVGLVSDFVLF